MQKRSKYHVDISEKGKEKRTYKGILYDSLAEMQFVKEFIEPRLESGEIKSYERQVEYVLQDKFKYNDKTILPIKYRSDFNVVWADDTLQVFDVKGNPDKMSLLKRKLVWAKYPEINLTFICRNLEYGGWIEYDTLKKLRKEDKKKKEQKD
ncbi:Protein of uncharacterised function (DUF1064) [uncultured Clostridium sp.]|nr:Protein of uncharacterised function (DUF1064) [uncultured Clostridium sp.]